MFSLSRPTQLALLICTAAAVVAAIAPDSVTAAQPLAPAGATNSPAAVQAPVPATTSTQSSTETTSAGGADVLQDPQRIAAGKDIWEQQCRHCHGRSAYPGKAPKLKPRKYTPEFVYGRVTNGFRKMPPWKDVFTDDERWSIVAWVMSKKFSP